MRRSLFAAVALTGVVVTACTGSEDGTPTTTNPPPATTAASAGSAPDPVATTTTTIATAGGTWDRLPDVADGFLTPDLFWLDDRVLVFYEATTEADAVAGMLLDPMTEESTDISDGGLAWRTLSAVGWTGDALLVYGGVNGGAPLGNGLYDPAADDWRRVAAAPVENAATRHTFWTGSHVLTITTDGVPLRYDPADDDWSQGTPNELLAGNDVFAGVWTGSEVVMWGGCDTGAPQCADTASGVDATGGGLAYDPETDEWRVLATSPLARRDRPSAVWTGDEMLVWGGRPAEGAGGAYGAAYDPEDDSWRIIADAPIPPRTLHSTVWTGSEMMVWGGPDAAGAAYNPESDSWRLLPEAPDGRSRHAAVWAGDRMLVFGGWPAGDALVFTPAP